MKHCIDCKHIEELAKGKFSCEKSYQQEESPVTGFYRTFSWCHNMRADPANPCGPDAKLFEAKAPRDKKGGFTGAEVIACYPASNAEACGYGESLRSAGETLGLPKGVFDRWRESLLEDGMIMRCGKGYKRTAAGDDLAKQAIGADIPQSQP